MDYSDMREILKLIGKVPDKEMSMAIGRFGTYLKANAIEAGVQRLMLGGLNSILRDEHSLEMGVMGALPFMGEPHYDLDETNRGYLLQLVDTVANAPVKRCDHNNLSILSLLHGGGLYPRYFIPELFCNDCYLNVSLFIFREKCPPYSEELERYGMRMQPCLEKDVFAWIDGINLMDCSPFGRIKSVGAEEIIYNPQAAYKAAPRFRRDLEGLDIVNKEKLESLSGS